MAMYVLSTRHLPDINFSVVNKKKKKKNISHEYCGNHKN